MVSGIMRKSWKSSAQVAPVEGFWESEFGFMELLDSQEWNQSLVVTSLADARLAPQL
jgi:hypothetical protein